jgi:hypothetical protein
MFLRWWTTPGMVQLHKVCDSISVSTTNTGQFDSDFSRHKMKLNYTSCTFSGFQTVESESFF